MIKSSIQGEQKSNELHVPVLAESVIETSWAPAEAVST